MATSTGDTEGELWIGQAGRCAHIHGGSYLVLGDKQALLAHAEFPEHSRTRRAAPLLAAANHELLA